MPSDYLHGLKFLYRIGRLLLASEAQEDHGVSGKEEGEGQVEDSQKPPAPESEAWGGLWGLFLDVFVFVHTVCLCL